MDEYISKRCSSTEEDVPCDSARDTELEACRAIAIEFNLPFLESITLEDRRK
jgi:hypothetical protein